MKTKLLVILLLAIVSTHSFAKEFIYQGKVKGMVCAFCVYGVSKSIAKIPGVDAETVNVDLKSGQVSFHSSSELSFKKVSGVFKGSGFKLVSLEESGEATHKMASYENKPTLVFKLAGTGIDKYGSIIESIGNIAAADASRIAITAPESVEIKILKPMIGGKQQSIRVQYTPKNDDGIKIELFQRSN